MWLLSIRMTGHVIAAPLYKDAAEQLVSCKGSCARATATVGASQIGGEAVWREMVDRTGDLKQREGVLAWELGQSTVEWTSRTVTRPFLPGLTLPRVREPQSVRSRCHVFQTRTWQLLLF